MKGPKEYFRNYYHVRNLVSKILILALVLVSTALYAQVFIEGKVIEPLSNSGIAYANMSIGSSYGTASDENGNFLLRIEPGMRKEKIKLSCIGYANLYLSIDSLCQLSENNIVIKLQPQIQLLEGVIVHEKIIDPEQLVKDAIASVSQNYSQEPFNMELYSIMSVRDSFKLHYVRECVLKSYRKGYVAESINHTKVLQTRSMGEYPLELETLNKKKVISFFPDFDLGLCDLLASGPQKLWTVFNPSIFKKFTFSFNGVSIFDGDTLRIVKYSMKKGSRKKYGGLLYISVKDLAIVKHQIALNNYILEIIYKKEDGRYFPYVIQTKRPVFWDPSYTITHEVFLRTIEQKNVEIIQRSFETTLPEDVPYDKTFWDANYPRKKQMP